MKEREELELILKLIGKYNLPLSPILEYAVKEKMEEYPEEEQITAFVNEESAEDNDVPNDIIKSNDISVDSLSEGLRIVDYGERTIAVVGNTKPHKDALKSIGGYFVFRTQWGPAWVFRDKKRDIIQAYINGDTSVITREEEEKEEPQKKRASRYIIRVKYPDGRVFDSNLVWETLVDVIQYAGPERVKQLNIICMGDNLVSPRLNENPIYRSAQKEIDRGLYVCTYSSTDIKFKQIVRINLDCKLGLDVEKVYIDEEKNTQTISSEDTPEWKEINFENKKPLNKRRLVLETVKSYVRHHPQVSYETLIRVFPASLNYNQANGVVKRYNDVLKKCAINPRTRNYFFLKDDEIIQLSNGLKVVVHSQWGDDFDKFLKVAKSLYKVTVSDDGYYLDTSTVVNERNTNGTSYINISVDSKEDKRIGYTVRLFPSQLKGEVIRVRKDAKGIKKLVVKTTNGDIVEVDDLPYLYEVLKRN